MKKFLLLLCVILMVFGGVGTVGATSLVNGLGGIGFGENSLARNDDGSTSAIDITSVFASGLNFFGTTYNSLYVNNNGNVTLNAAMSTYTPSAITGVTSNPMFAPFFADVDTRSGVLTATTGGTSMGTNLVYWDLDTTNKVFTATWDDVGYYSYQTSPLNAFQLQLADRSDVGAGDFDITFIYEEIGWTVGSVSGSAHARAGWTSGNGTNFYEMSQSGDVAELTNLENTPGRITWQVRNGGIEDTGGTPDGSPVPEPATMLLFGLGLLGLAGVNRKK